MFEGKLNNLSKEIFEGNKVKGFWDEGVENRNFGEIIALIHSEVSEALEAHRDGKFANREGYDWGMSSNEWYENKAKDSFENYIKNSVEDELADVIIRVLDYCGAKGIDIEWHIVHKLLYNKLRGHKHGKAY